MSQHQKGFTLVELIVVIVILGILAATALPRFVNLQGDARAAAMQGLAGAMEGAKELVRGKWLAVGSTSAATVTIGDGTTVAVNTAPATIAGLPTSAAMNGGAVSIPTGVTCAGDPLVCTHSALAGCTVTYAGGTTGAVTVAATAATCGGN